MHTRHFVSASFLLASLLLVGVGCGQKASVTGDSNASPTAEGQVASEPVSKPADVCGNPYYPFKPGLAIAYSVTPSVPGESDYTTRIESVVGSTATIRSEMGGGISDMEAECTNGKIVMKGTVDLGAAEQGAKFKTTVITSTGMYMPADVRVGSTWSNSGTLKIEQIEGPTTDSGLGAFLVTTAEQGRAVGEETVTVPAGTYQALKVELTSNSTMEFENPPTNTKLPPGMKLPEKEETALTSTEWWVKGIGMVKTVTTSGERVSTVEAQSITGL